MTHQRLIFAKIGGKAADHTVSRFDDWYRQRTSDSRTEWNLTQWPAAARYIGEVDARVHYSFPVNSMFRPDQFSRGQILFNKFLSRSASPLLADA